MFLCTHFSIKLKLCRMRKLIIEIGGNWNEIQHLMYILPNELEVFHLFFSFFVNSSVFIVPNAFYAYAATALKPSQLNCRIAFHVRGTWCDFGVVNKMKQVKRSIFEFIFRINYYLYGIVIAVIAFIMKTRSNVWLLCECVCAWSLLAIRLRYLNPGYGFNALEYFCN